MGKYAWCTDVHLDFLQGSDDKLVKFANELIVGDPTGIFMTGDISVAPSLVYHLSVIERVVQRPIYFVLGNHDYYGNSTEAVRKTMREVSNMSQYLKYMPVTPYVPLTQTTAVVGHDGWYDALLGDWQNSTFAMTDWMSIHDFLPASGGKLGMQTGAGFNKGSIVAQARKMAHEGVLHVQNGIKKAVRFHKQIVVLTHFPPFAESHIFQGKVGDANAMPWFTSKLMGDMLLDAARSFPNTGFIVLAGHTHGEYHGNVLKNLAVHVGGAEYGQPKLQNLIDVA